MIYLGSTLCFEYSELVPIIFSKDNYRYHKDAGNIKTHGVGGNGRSVLIEYETLPVKYKKAVNDYYGCPYSYASKQPILKNLEADPEAEKYYQNYILPNGLKLPSSNFTIDGKKQINYVQRYSEAAMWLNMLDKLTADKRTLKQELNISIGMFWQTISELIKTKKVSLPSTPKRLKEKLKGYQAEGYGYLIETHKFGNDYSKKIVGDVAEALLKEMLSLRNKHADTTIAEEYNKWAISEGLKPITPEAVGYWRKKWKSELLFEREGMGKAYSQLSKQGRRKRPSAPLLLINSDDNVLDLFYKAPSNDWFRPVLYVVTDTFNDYILGYAVGASVTNELVYEAYRNAHRHVMELTGGSYCWQQIQTDRWGISGKNTTELEQFYHSMATFTPAGLKNSQSKYIERSFGTVWHKTLKKLFPFNYSGHNLTAKQKLNRDQLKPAYFPEITDAHQQIAVFIEAMRQTKRTDCDLTRQQEWLQAFHASEKSQKRLLSDEQRLQIFGKKHTHLNRIEAKGLTPTLLGKERIYELSQEFIFEHIDKKVQVYYDEYDLSKILITNGKGIRQVVHQYQLLPSALADFEEGDKTRLNLLLEEKKQMGTKIHSLIASRKEVLERAEIDAQSRIQAGVMVKEIAHKDQQLITSTQSGATVENDEEEAVNIYEAMLKSS